METLGNSLEDAANVDTLADTLSEVEAERLGNTRQCVGQGTNGHASLHGTSSKVLYTFRHIAWSAGPTTGHHVS